MTFEEWFAGRVFTQEYKTIEEFMRIAWNAAANAEREACAKICDEYSEGSRQNMADVCADKIRMRSNAELTGKPTA